MKTERCGKWCRAIQRYGADWMFLSSLLLILMFTLILAAPRTVFAFQEVVTLRVLGDPIVVNFAAPPDVLRRFPEVTVTAVLKGGVAIDIAWQGVANTVLIPTVGLSATEEEQKQGKTVKKGNIAFLWGLQDRDERWHSLDELDYIAVQHTPATPGTSFNGYRTELRVVWIDKAWRTVHDGQTTRFNVQAQLRTRFVGGRIEFLESQSGQPAPRTAGEQITLEFPKGTSPASARFSRGEEVILAEGTQITNCQLDPQTQARYTLNAPCQWTWPPSEGTAKVVLVAKQLDFAIPYDRNGAVEDIALSSMRVFVANANGEAVESRVTAGRPGILIVRGTATTTSARFTLKGDPNFEDMESVEVPIDGGQLKLVRRRPHVLSIRGSELRIQKIRSAEIMDFGRWVALVSPAQLDEIRPELNSSVIKIPVDKNLGTREAKIIALTYFEGNKTQIRERTFCFLLGSAETIDLDNSERTGDCLDNSRQIILNMTLRGQPFRGGIQFLTRGIKGQGVIDLTGGRPLTGQNLPDVLILKDNALFEDGQWDLKGQFEVSINLAPKKQDIALLFLDAGGQPIQEGVTVRATMGNQVGELNSSTPECKVSLRVIPKDLIRIAATSANYESNSEFAYEGTNAGPVRVTMTPRRERVAANGSTAIRVRPFFKARGKEQSVDATIQAFDARCNGSSTATVLRKSSDADGYTGALNVPAGTPVAASFELGRGQSRPPLALPGNVSIPNGRNAVEVYFARPTIAVLFNPSASFQKALNSRIEEVKQQTWKVFEELTKPAWDENAAYRYFGVIAESDQSVESGLVKAVETTPLDVSSISRERAVGAIEFKAIEVPALKAVKAYGRFLDGFSYPASSNHRGTLVYVQAGEAAPVLSVDPDIDELNRELEKERIKAVVVQLSPGQGKPKVLTKENHANLKLLEFSMGTESRDDYRSAFDKVIDELSSFQLTK